MKTIVGIFGLLYKLYFGIVFYITLIVLYPLIWFLTNKESRYKYCFKLKIIWSRLLQILLLIYIKKEKQHKFTDEPVIVCANHSSYLDIVFMYTAAPTPFLFIGKSELLKWPLFKRFFKTMDIAVDRKNRMAAARVLDKAKEAIDKDWSISIFPEGTISTKVPVVQRFKDGAFKLAIEKQIPIVPVSFMNNWFLFSDPSEVLGRAHPGIAKVTVHKAIETKGMTAKDLVSLRKQVFDVIEKPIKNYNQSAYENR